jgi:hypothetical protein
VEQYDPLVRGTFSVGARTVELHDAARATAPLAAHVTSALLDYYALLAEQLNVGKVGALAAASPSRVEALPDVPGHVACLSVTNTVYLALRAPGRPNLMAGHVAACCNRSGGPAFIGQCRRRPRNAGARSGHPAPMALIGA